MTNLILEKSMVFPHYLEYAFIFGELFLAVSPTQIIPNWWVIWFKCTVEFIRLQWCENSSASWIHINSMNSSKVYPLQYQSTTWFVLLVRKIVSANPKIRAVVLLSYMEVLDIPWTMLSLLLFQLLDFFVSFLVSTADCVTLLQFKNS